MNDDELIERLRSALDEVHSTDTGAPVSIPAGARPTSNGRWVAVAAAVALVAVGVAAIAVNRGRPAPGNTDSLTATSTVATPTTTPAGQAIDPNWFVLNLPGFTPSAEHREACCPPLPAPGPATVMAWGDVNGLDHGLLLLTATPSFDRMGPTLSWQSAMMPDERMQTLIHEVVPGSGVPYVLPAQSMVLLGSGLHGVGNLRSQIWADGTGEVTVSVGDYRGQLQDELDGTIERLTIAGRTAWRMRSDAADTAVWQTPNGQWAMVTIDPALAGREDEIISAIEAAPASSVPPTTLPSSTVLQSTVYRGNVGGIIDSGDGRGPMLTFFWLDSLPPQGGSLPLAGFDWDMVEGERTMGSTTWFEQSVGLTGTFDGTTFTLTEPVSSPFAITDDVLTYGTLTEGCSEADTAPAIAALNALDQQRLGLIESSDYVWDGHCGVQVYAMFDTPELRAAVATLGDDVMVRIAFHPVD